MQLVNNKNNGEKYIHSSLDVTKKTNRQTDSVVTASLLKDEK